jgi:hypothetical protein
MCCSIDKQFEKRLGSTIFVAKPYGQKTFVLHAVSQTRQSPTSRFLILAESVCQRSLGRTVFEHKSRNQNKGGCWDETVLKGLDRRTGTEIPDFS